MQLGQMLGLIQVPEGVRVTDKNGNTTSIEKFEKKNGLWVPKGVRGVIELCDKVKRGEL